MIGETLLYRVLETPPVALKLLQATSFIHVKKHHSVIEGVPLPKEGGAFIIGNHHAQADSYLTCEAARQVGRQVYPVVKMSLIVDGAYESAEYLKKIGDKADPLEYDAIKAAVMRGSGAIGLLRDHPTLEFVRQTKKVAAANELFGIFLQDTRDEDGLIRNLKPGPAFYVRRQPTKPIYLAAFSDEQATFLEPTSYEQLSEEYCRPLTGPGSLTNGELTIIFADRIASAAPQRVQDDWQERRFEEINRIIIPQPIRARFLDPG